MAKTFEFGWDVITGGRLTAEALLHSEGTVSFPVAAPLFRSKIMLFHIACPEWWFNLGYNHGRLILQKSLSCLVLTPEELGVREEDSFSMLASWRPDELMLCRGELSRPVPPIWSRAMRPDPPPASLLRWARLESLLPTQTYARREEFVLRVNSAINGIATKIARTHDTAGFWDVERSRSGAVVSRRPKRETDLHGLIHTMLADQMLISSIEVHPEAAGGSGRLDFLFVGVLADGTQAKVAAEFKLAHNSHLVRGAAEQLPAYMRDHGTEDGCYCVLDFRGPWFNQPVDLTNSIHAKVTKALASHPAAARSPIKMHWIDVGR